MSTSRGLLTLIAFLTVGGGAVVAVRQRDHNKQVMRSIWSDVHNLSTAQEAYFADHGTYSKDLARVQYGIRNGSVIRLVSANDTSWAATATHPGTSRVCSSSKVKGKNWGMPDCR
jgi:hypothetical protein